MSKLIRLLIIPMMIIGITGVAVSMPGSVAQAASGPPSVVNVPASALNPAVPHDTWSGLEITLKGTAHDPDGDHTLFKAGSKESNNRDCQQITRK